MEIEINVNDIISSMDRTDKEEMFDELLWEFDKDYVIRALDIDFDDLELVEYERRSIFEDLKEEFDPEVVDMKGDNPFLNKNDFRRYMCDLVGAGYQQLSDDELLQEIKKRL
jgi:hypothetical protein